MVGVLLAGCVPNVSGRVAAEQVGELLDPPAPRLDAVVQRCGEPNAQDGMVERAPYLQAVTTDGAAVVWTQTEGGARVALTTLEGQPVDIFQGVPEDTTHLEGATQYVARIDGLAPGETYCYALQDGQGRVLAGPFALTSAPQDAERVEIVAFGDSGGATDDQLMLAEQLKTVPADLMLHTGDLAYPSGTVPHFEAGYFDVYADLIDEIPLFPTSGNHEYDTDGAAPFREVFVLPERERWYSFDWGPVHVVALDNEVDGKEQAEWLRRDLAASDAPWTIVITHKGPYSAGAHGPNDAWRELYQPIVEAHGVQLVLSGHDHHYERSVPIGGVTYVVTGGGGYSTRPVGERWTTAFAEDVTHFVYLSVEGDRMRLHAIDATGQEFDGVEIPRR